MAKATSEVEILNKSTVIELVIQAFPKGTRKFYKHLSNKKSFIITAPENKERRNITQFTL